jgi:hypothetical protein
MLGVGLGLRAVDIPPQDQQPRYALQQHGLDAFFSAFGLVLLDSFPDRLCCDAFMHVAEQPPRP